MDYRKFLAAIALAAAAVPAPAAAVPASSDATGETLILVPLKLTKIDDLDFGSVIPSAVSGTVTINAVSGARSFTGGVTGAPGAVGNRGYFGTAGSPNQLVFIAVTPPTELVSTTNPTDKVPVLAITLDGSPIRTIDPATRTFFFGLGGVLQINSNQADGLYQNTFDITAIYL